MAKRKTIPIEIKLRLFAESAGHCQNPICLQPLFPVKMGGDKHIAEMAHVIPHGEKGPRHEERPPSEEFETDSFENLMLLCPTCHTIVDKDPNSYSRSTLIEWKSKHLAALAHRQGVRCYDERSEVSGAVSVIMAENQAIWNEYAPVDGMCFEYNPESDCAKTWEHRMRAVVIPNHFRIEAIIKKNKRHMMNDEPEIFARYQEHVRGLVARHLGGVAGGIRYPKKMNGIFL